jgi:hypothetical protein
VCTLYEHFFETAVAADATEHAALFALYDLVITQRSVLSAMLLSAREFGTHGAARVDNRPARNDAARNVRTLTRGATSHIEAVSPMPDPELWFETLLARKRGLLP